MLDKFTLFGAAMLAASCAGPQSIDAPWAQGVIAVAPDSQPEPPDASLTATGAEPVPVADGATIAGQWDVVTFEGYRPRRLSGTTRAAFADFSADGVALRIECNYSGRAGAVRDGRFVISPNNDGGQTVMSCGPERNARESRFFRFFDKGPTVERLGPDRLRLRAGEAELILARPAAHRLEFLPAPAELQGRWRLLEVTRYGPRGGTAGIGLSEVPGRIVISGDRIFYSRCPQHALAYRLGAEGSLQKTGGSPLPATPGGCRELAEPAAAPGLPTQWDALRLLHASPLVEKSGDDTLMISTGELGLLITRAPCQSLEQSNDHRSSRVVDCAAPE